jgi:pPIWI_RE three-gene island domain Y/REase associating with pPIWI_RE
MTTRAENPAVPDGTALLRTVATAIVVLSRRQAPGDPVYEDRVQRAYNHLVLHCIHGGTEPPASIPHMIAWAARTPLAEWPADLSAAAAGGGEVLVDDETRTPTQACLEWAMPVADAASELFENSIIEDAIAACRAARSPRSYTAFRRLLITRPVLTAAELAALAAEVELMPVFEVIRRSYERAPSSYLTREGFQLCGRCGCLLVPLRNGGYRCDLDRCRNDGDTTLGPALPATTGVLQLSRPLRVFITSPGIAETDLETTLRKGGLHPQMWPQFDAYDLRIPFPDGTAWAIDVKDWANPSLLAVRTRALRADPPHDRAFIVVPAYRFRVREDYARAFRHALAQELRGHITVCSDEELARLARRELRRIKRATANEATSSGPTTNGGNDHA